MRIAAAQPVRNLIFAQHRRQAFHVALVRRGQHNPRLRGHQRAQLLGQRRNRTMKSERGPRVQLNLAQRVVLVQHVHHTQLVEV